MSKKEYSRAQRVGELIQRELAHIIRREIHQPGLGMLTISLVEISVDLKLAKVYITTLGGDWTINKTVQYFNETAGFLRYQLSKRLTLRVTPRLQFLYDTSLEYGVRLSALIDSIASPHLPSQDTEELGERE